MTPTCLLPFKLFKANNSKKKNISWPSHEEHLHSWKKLKNIRINNSQFQTCTICNDSQLFLNQSAMNKIHQSKRKGQITNMKQKGGNTNIKPNILKSCNLYTGIIIKDNRCTNIPAVPFSICPCTNEHGDS
jgi:hypothetical protein